MTGRAFRRAVLPVLASVVVGIGCADHDFEPPDRAARVSRAAAAYSAQLFDSVAWADSSAMLVEGNTVYAEECRRCHGQLGMGNTAYARERNLTLPSLVEPVWPLAELDTLRRTIYVGHESGMPVYGDGDLTPRQIDALAAYILLVLRPDVLEQD